MRRDLRAGVRAAFGAAFAVAPAALAAAILLAAPAAAAEAPDGPEADAPPPTYHTPLRRFSVSYDAPEDTARVALWVTENGGAEWRRYGFDPDAKSPVGFATDHDGTFGFFVAAQDRAGNLEEPAPGTAPQLVMVVDGTPPAVELLEPNGGFVGPAHGAVVRWRASDEYVDEDSARVEYSADGGATWSEIAAGRPAVGSFTWDMKEVRPAGARAFRFRASVRDRAGNAASAASGAEVLLDDELPTAVATGPGGPAGAEVRVTYDADDAGGAGLESVRLYASADGGGEWRLVATDDDALPPVLWRPERAGSYGLFVAATDRAGNASPAPVAGARPQLVVEVRRRLEVKLKNLHTGGYYKGGSVLSLLWEAADPAAAAWSVRLEHSIDGGNTWDEIARDLAPWGGFDWTVPTVDTKKALVRVVAEAPSGGSGSDVSRRPFVIDSTPPRAVVAFDPSAQDVPEPLATQEPPPLVGPEELEAAPSDDAASPEAAGPPPPPREIVRAREHLEARRYDEAVRELRSFLAREPAHVEANVVLGVAVARAADRLGRGGGPRPEEALRRYGEAAAALRTALQVGPASNEARVWLGACHIRRAEILHLRLRRRGAAAAEAATAAAEYEKALSAEPNPPDEYYHAGVAHYILASAGGRRERARAAERAGELFSRALEGAAPDAAGRAHYYLAELAETHGDAAAALGHWEKVVELLGGESDLEATARRRIARLQRR